MNNKNENIDLWTGRFFIIIFFLFVLSFWDSDSKADSNSISIDQIVVVDNSAILVKTTDYTSNNDYPANSKFLCINANNSQANDRFTNKAINQQFKHQKLRFFKVKPNLLRIYSSNLISNSEDDYFMIS